MIYCKTSVTVIWWVGSSRRALKGPDHLISFLCEGSGHKPWYYISLYMRQLSTWKSKSWDLTLPLQHCVPQWRDPNLELFGQGLLFAGRVRACRREEVSLEQDFIGKSWDHSWLMYALQHEQSYQKLLVRLDQKIEGFACWSVIHFFQMTYGLKTFSKRNGNQNSPMN